MLHLQMRVRCAFARAAAGAVQALDLRRIAALACRWAPTRISSLLNGA